MGNCRSVVSKIFNKGGKNASSVECEERVFSVPPKVTDIFCENSVSTTKYNVFTFLPKFLYEQFKKLSNCYFLTIAILQNIPMLGHTGKTTTVIPLTVILFISCVKELYEDFKRYVLDKKTNRTTCKALEFYWNKVNWSSLTVGSVIKLAEDEVCPADIILISTSNENSSCFISTMSLDGETNLKLKEATKATEGLCSVDHFKNMSISVKCEAPNSNINDFNGSIKVGDNSVVSLSNDNIILRGSVIRSTEWVVGICVYTGHDTKLLKNSVAAPIKRSKYEMILNSLIIVLFIIQISCSVVFGTLSDVLSHTSYKKHWYLNSKENEGVTILINVGNMALLFHTMIPISFSVTIEFIRLFQAYMMNVDKRMYDPARNAYLTVKTSNILEDLGQVNFIFTDKTGTLTKNIMTLKTYSVNGEIYNVNIPIESSEIVQNHQLMLFYRMLCICNSVYPQNHKNVLSPDNTDTIVYTSSSPDELAMVNYLKEINYKMKYRSSQEIVLDEFGIDSTWKLLCMIAFTSERKRMTVIAESPSGEIYLFCKGADSVIFERKASSGQYCDDITFEHVDTFASTGYRTLCFAYRIIDRDEYYSWYETYANASLNPQEYKNDIQNMIEKDLIILAVTAVQDELQNRVVSTLRILNQAGITIWVLTGDRTDTSINIGYSTGIIDKKSEVILIDEENEDTLFEKLTELNLGLSTTLRMKGKKVLFPSKRLNYSIVISGDCLEMAVNSKCRQPFLCLVLPAISVICCRASPIQKKMCVELIKNDVYDMVTLAIGDGANDCSMIQTANVGVGIYGSEGSQAANSADFAMCQFSHLKPLLLFHGGSFYRRVCTTTLYSFYKNFVLTLIEMFYLFHNFYSGTLLVSPIVVACYNLLFTALPPLAMGLFDRPVSSQAFMHVPQLYWTTQSDRLLSVRKFIYCTINSVVHAALLYFFIYYTFRRYVIDQTGIPVNSHQMSFLFAFHLLILVTLKACLEMTSWTWLTVIVMGIGLTTFVIIFSVLCRPFIALKYFPELLNIDLSLYTSPLFWVSIPLPIIIVVPDFIFYMIRNVFFTPSSVAVGMLERNSNIDWTQETTQQILQERLQSVTQGRSLFMTKYLGFAFSIYHTKNS